MMMYVPRAPSMPPMSAAPEPLVGTSITRAPCARAMSCEPSVEPLSATITSPTIPDRCRYSCALSIQTASVSASLRHGMTMESSTEGVGVGMAVLSVRGSYYYVYGDATAVLSVRGCVPNRTEWGDMNIGLVVSPLGRTEPLERLLRSLTDQLTGDDHVVIVAQQRLAEVTALANRFRDAPWPITVTTSAPGAARGRNVGVAALPPGDRLLHFPNDTTWFPPGTLAAVRAAMGNGEGGVGALTIVDEHGPKFVLPPPGSSLTIWNVWQVIEMGILIRRSLFDQIGGFDPLLGTGALSPWQAGEATDLLLRLRVTRPDVAASFTWLPAHITVGGVADPAGLSTRERRRKLRAYGRGMGRVVARHRYPFWWRAAFTVGGLAFGLRHRATNTVLDGWWVFLGRAEGALGRTLGDGATAAVTR